MEIIFKKLDGLKIEEYTIREMTDSYSDCEGKRQYTAFQAIVSGKDISKNSIIHFFSKYYDKDRIFLGSDNGDIWVQGKRNSVSISTKVTIPDNTTIVEIEFENRKDFAAYIGWLWGIGMFILLFLGINSLFD